jgi:hypothetical protein
MLYPHGSTLRRSLMTMRRRRPRSAALVSLAAFSLALTGCGGAGAPDDESRGVPDRGYFYESLDELAGDSDLIVTGLATSNEERREANDPSLDWTITTVKIASTIKSESGDLTGTSIVVRQTGSKARPIMGWPILVEDTTYLLALQESKGPDALPSEYFISGGSTGLFEASDDSRDGAPVFKAVARDSGDDLPEAVTTTDLAG